MDVARQPWLGGGMVGPGLFTPEEGGFFLAAVLALENVTFSHKTELLGCI
jgi:hypothetical protein